MWLHCMANKLTFVTSPNADLFLVGALLGDSSAILFAFSLVFLLSEIIILELVVITLVEFS